MNSMDWDDIFWPSKSSSYKIGLMLGKTPPPLNFVGVCIVIGTSTSCLVLSPNGESSWIPLGLTWL